MILGLRFDVYLSHNYLGISRIRKWMPSVCVCCARIANSSKLQRDHLSIVVHPLNICMLLSRIGFTFIKRLRNSWFFILPLRNGARQSLSSRMFGPITGGCQLKPSRFHRFLLYPEPLAPKGIIPDNFWQYSKIRSVYIVHEKREMVCALYLVYKEKCMECLALNHCL